MSVLSAQSAPLARSARSGGDTLARIRAEDPSWPAPKSAAAGSAPRVSSGAAAKLRASDFERPSAPTLDAPQGWCSLWAQPAGDWPSRCARWRWGEGSEGRRRRATSGDPGEEVG